MKSDSVALVREAFSLCGKSMNRVAIKDVRVRNTTYIFLSIRKRLDGAGFAGMGVRTRSKI